MSVEMEDKQDNEVNGSSLFLTEAEVREKILAEAVFRREQLMEERYQKDLARMDAVLNGASGDHGLSPEYLQFIEDEMKKFISRNPNNRKPKEVINDRKEATES
jgi:hypothetical protein